MGTPTNPFGECRVALSNVPMIEVFSVTTLKTLDGNGVPMTETQFSYKLATTSPCLSLDFCLGTAAHIIASFEDGLCILYDLEDASTSMIHGSPGGMSPVSINDDRTLIILSAENYFRICKPSPFERSPGA